LQIYHYSLTFVIDFRQNLFETFGKA
jgi:hypothetical protein